jgi:hypothetical protein
MSVVNCNDFRAVLSFGMGMLLRPPFWIAVAEYSEPGMRALLLDEMLEVQQLSTWSSMPDPQWEFWFFCVLGFNCWLYISPPSVLNPSRPAYFHDHFHSFTIWNPHITLSKMHEHLWYFGNFVGNLSEIYSLSCILCSSVRTSWIDF